MRHFALAALAAIVVAIVLVLVLGEEEVAEDRKPTATTTPTVTREAPPRNAGHGGDPALAPRHPRRQDDRIEQAVARYVEAAERGAVDAPGLPTSDELSLVGIYIAGRRAKAALAGGATVHLRRAGGRWRVVRARVPTPEPTPPSNGP